jgi:hypothetical protein
MIIHGDRTNRYMVEISGAGGKPGGNLKKHVNL